MSTEKTDSGLTLPDIPKKKDYEDYVAALLQAGGYYLERGVILRLRHDFLELDIVSTKFEKDKYCRILAEVKSGGWGYSDVFKVRGWLDYLELDKANFIVQKTTDDMDLDKIFFDKIKVHLVNDKQLDDGEIYNAYNIKGESVSSDVVAILRYSYALEKEMLLTLQCRKKSEPENVGFNKLDKFIFNVSNNVFFEPAPIDKLSALFALYTDNKNITARISKELNGETYPDNGDKLFLETSDFKHLFYDATEPDILYVSLYAELMSRLAIMKACIEDILIGKDKKTLAERIKYFDLPANIIIGGLYKLKGEKYFYLYPYFWQVFIYLFGGFILKCKQKEEYQLLSDYTGISNEEIPNALDAFDLLFPLVCDSWFIDQRHTEIQVMQFFPVPFRGIGVIFRAFAYKWQSVDNMKKALNGEHTVDDMTKWARLTMSYLEMDKRHKN